MCQGGYVQSNQLIGLIKFFRNEDFLDKLVNGTFYCRPPEVYRLDEQEGISDKFESCNFSYRKSRKDDEIILHINDRKITEHTSLTVRKKADKDSWMHCWFSLRLPQNEKSLDQLKLDIVKMKREFGGLFAFIPAPSIGGFLDLIEELSPLPMVCDEVEYSADNSHWGSLHKSLDYSYQREFRLLFGECNTHETEPFVFSDPNKFSDIILKNPELKIKNKDNSITWLEI
jgi:hypothetical protein